MAKTKKKSQKAKKVVKMPVLSEKKMASKNYKANSPWVQYANGLRELFKRDPQLTLEYDENKGEKPKVTITVANNERKESALKRLLPGEIKFGNVPLTIEIKCNRRGGSQYMPQTIADAFEGNPLFRYLHFWNDPKATNNPFCWVQMANEIIMYPNDDLSNLYGDTVILPGDLAQEILGCNLDYIFFNTINPDRPIPEVNNIPEDFKKKKFTCDPDG